MHIAITSRYQSLQIPVNPPKAATAHSIHRDGYMCNKMLMEVQGIVNQVTPMIARKPPSALEPPLAIK